MGIERLMDPSHIKWIKSTGNRSSGKDVNLYLMQSRDYASVLHFYYEIVQIAYIKYFISVHIVV